MESLIVIIATIILCLFIGFKVGTFLEEKYWESYIEHNKDTEIDRLKHIIIQKDDRINDLVTGVCSHCKYRRWYTEDQLAGEEDYDDRE